MIKNIANLPETVSLISLTRGNYVIVDTKNLRMLNVHRWHLAIKSVHKRYARRTEGDKTIYMHREIIDVPADMEVDHINGNGLDNREANLRICTRTQNMRNAAVIENKTSIYKGVGWCKGKKKWRARITHNNKLIYIGRYHDEVRAAQAYDKKAIELFGEFAHPNFPNTNE